MKKIILIMTIFAVLLIAGCSTGSLPTESDVVKIGWMGPLSGDAASYGESIKRGVELAVKDSGLDVEIIYEDSKCDGSEAVNVVNKLISLDKVSAIIGEVCSGATLAAAPIANQNKIVMISASSTSPKLSKAGAYIFRTVPSDALQGDFGANLVRDTGHDKLAVIYSNEEYGVGFTDVLIAGFEGRQGEVVASESFEKGTSDVRSQLTKIKDADPDSIYIISNSPDSAVAVLNQIVELGIEADLYGAEGLKSPDIIDGAGSSAEGLIISSVSSGTSAFAQKHEAEYGEAPGPFAAQGYDAYMAIAKALELGAKTGTEIKDALVAIEFDGASGSIKFDSNGDVSGNYDIFEIVNGEFDSVR